MLASYQTTHGRCCYSVNTVLLPKARNLDITLNPASEKDAILYSEYSIRFRFQTCVNLVQEILQKIKEIKYEAILLIVGSHI